MTLVELLKIANKGYPDGALALYFNPETGKVDDLDKVHGDTLALFVVRELASTFERDATDEEQLNTAADAIEDAISNLGGVQQALDDASAGAAGEGDDGEEDKT